ncbi:hypothetical protein BDU57DRAFT_580028 [Ampelomyces quisqualis]|uniref:Uncharacterized protein n=1 Tax=Ampelomyces quisqualis TaxID=50730 RepID=A0A6A5QFK2_AMPQU|nr:hypothetical protein BDU57DRAFT_580028 [Ampelomyces quisqualis]
MSLSFQLQKINQSIELIASWYHQFMHRTEVYFRNLHERVLRLESQPHAPSDEQVERVLRKILADRFSDGIAQEVHSPDILNKEDCLVDAQNELANFKPIHVDPALLLVDPNAVPSKAYVETMKLHDRGLDEFPKLDRHRVANSGTNITKLDYDSRHSTQ